MTVTAAPFLLNISAITKPSPPLLPFPQRTVIFLPLTGKRLMIISVADFPARYISSRKEKAPLFTAFSSELLIKASVNTRIAAHPVYLKALLEMNFGTNLTIAERTRSSGAKTR